MWSLILTLSCFSFFVDPLQGHAYLPIRSGFRGGSFRVKIFWGNIVILPRIGCLSPQCIYGRRSETWWPWM